MQQRTMPVRGVPPDSVLRVIGDGDNDQSSKAREKKASGSFRTTKGIRPISAWLETKGNWRERVYKLWVRESTATSHGHSPCPVTWKLVCVLTCDAAKHVLSVHTFWKETTTRAWIWKETSRVWFWKGVCAKFCSSIDDKIHQLDHPGTSNMLFFFPSRWF